MITQHSFRGPIAKPSVALTAALLVFAFSLSARAAIVTNSLDIHYRADNTSGTTVTDLAGTQDATMVGNVTVTENSGEASSSPFRYGLTFDGDDDYLDLDTYNLGTDNPSALTYEFWLKVEDPPSGKRGGLYGEFPSNTSGKNDTRNYFAISDGEEDKNKPPSINTPHRVTPPSPRRTCTLTASSCSWL